MNCVTIILLRGDTPGWSVTCSGYISCSHHFFNNSPQPVIYCDLYICPDRHYPAQGYNYQCKWARLRTSPLERSSTVPSATTPRSSTVPGATTPIPTRDTDDIQLGEDFMSCNQVMDDISLNCVDVVAPSGPAASLFDSQCPTPCLDGRRQPALFPTC